MDEKLYTKREVVEAIREAFQREVTNFREVLATEGLPALSVLIGALEYGETVALHAVELLDGGHRGP